MCAHHWRRVPRPLAVLEAWNGGHPRPWYLETRAAAIAAVPAPQVAIGQAAGVPKLDRVGHVK